MKKSRNSEKLLVIPICFLLLLTDAQGLAAEPISDVILENCKETRIDSAQRIVLKILTGTTASSEEIVCTEELSSRKAILDSDKNYLLNEILDSDFRVNAAQIFVNKTHETITRDLYKEKTEVRSNTIGSTTVKKNKIETIPGFHSINGQ